MSIKEPPTVSVYLDILEKRRAYKRHATQLAEITVHPGVTVTSPPPPVPRIELYEKCRTRNRMILIQTQEENMQNIREVYRQTQERQAKDKIRVRKSIPTPPSNKKWSDHLLECEERITFLPKHEKPQSAIKLSFPELKPLPQRSFSSTRKRVITDSGMTVVDDGPNTSRTKGKANVFVPFEKKKPDPIIRNSPTSSRRIPQKTAPSVLSNQSEQKPNIVTKTESKKVKKKVIKPDSKPETSKSQENEEDHLSSSTMKDEPRPTEKSSQLNNILSNALGILTNDDPKQNEKPLEPMKSDKFDEDFEESDKKVSESQKKKSSSSSSAKNARESQTSKSGAKLSSSLNSDFEDSAKPSTAEKKSSDKHSSSHSHSGKSDSDKHSSSHSHSGKSDSDKHSSSHSKSAKSDENAKTNLSENDGFDSFDDFDTKKSDSSHHSKEDSESPKHSDSRQHSSSSESEEKHSDHSDHSQKSSDHHEKGALGDTLDAVVTGLFGESKSNEPQATVKKTDELNQDSMGDPFDDDQLSSNSNKSNKDLNEHKSDSEKDNSNSENEKADSDKSQSDSNADNEKKESENHKSESENDKSNSDSLGDPFDDNNQSSGIGQERSIPQKSDSDNEKHDEHHSSSDSAPKESPNLMGLVGQVFNGLVQNTANEDKQSSDGNQTPSNEINNSPKQESEKAQSDDEHQSDPIVQTKSVSENQSLGSEKEKSDSDHHLDDEHQSEEDQSNPPKPKSDSDDLKQEDNHSTSDHENKEAPNVMGLVGQVINGFASNDQNSPKADESNEDDKDDSQETKERDYGDEVHPEPVSDVPIFDFDGKDQEEKDEQPPKFDSDSFKDEHHPNHSEHEKLDDDNNEKDSDSEKTHHSEEEPKVVDKDVKSHSDESDKPANPLQNMVGHMFDGLMGNGTAKLEAEEKESESGKMNSENFFNSNHSENEQADSSNKDKTDSENDKNENQQKLEEQKGADVLGMAGQVLNGFSANNEVDYGAEVNPDPVSDVPMFDFDANSTNDDNKESVITKSVDPEDLSSNHSESSKHKSEDDHQQERNYEDEVNPEPVSDVPIFDYDNRDHQSDVLDPNNDSHENEKEPQSDFLNNDSHENDKETSNLLGMAGQILGGFTKNNDNSSPEPNDDADNSNQNNENKEVSDNAQDNFEDNDNLFGSDIEDPFA